MSEERREQRMERKESGASFDGEKVGSLVNPRKFRDQDYYSLREQCIHNNFQDETFPADLSSIRLSDVQVVKWKRPYEIHPNPQFYVEGVSRFDLCQGRVGDCWFLAALGALTMNENMFSQVVPSNQSCQQNYCGIFHFRFWHFGDWTDVVVDDQLPTDERGNLIFVHSSDKNEFWCALLEKAYAKLQGSYADLHMGQISEALVDFTGGILIDIELAKAPDNLWQWMQKADNQRLFMGCSTPSGKLEFKLPNGLLLTHAYTVTGIKEVLTKNQKEQLVRVRNPWGNAEWNGSWSDNSKEWDIVDPKVKKRLLLNRNDGEFWMALKDFMANFKRLVFCSPNPDFMIDQSHLQWHYACHQEKWVKGVTAGGKMRYKDTFWMNPQYLFTLKEDDVDPRAKTSIVMVFLMQKSRGQYRKQYSHLPIACFLFKVPPTSQVQRGKMPPTFFTEMTLVRRQTQLMRAREVVEIFHLRPGTYVLVPCTEIPGNECGFVLRTFYQKKDGPRNMNFNSNLEKASSQSLRSNNTTRSYSLSENHFTPMSPIASKTTFKWPERQYSWFEDHPEPISPSFPERLHLNSITQSHSSSESDPVPMSPTTFENLEIDDGYLQRILNENFLEGYKTREGFSLDTARFILLYMDVNNSGHVSWPEFGHLWRKLTHYKDLFCQCDVENLGFLQVTQLCNCLRAADYPVTKPVRRLLCRRYGDTAGRVDLVGFTCCFLRMDFTMKTFNKLGKGAPGISLSADQWMIISAYF